MVELIKKCSILFIVSLLIFPSAVKFAHAFSNHESTYCFDFSESHFHEEALDCDLCEFQQNSFSGIAIFNYELHTPEPENSSPTSVYNFLSDYQKLPFSLRGPPSLA